MNVNISQIELNQLTQSRVEINDEIVSDYKDGIYTERPIPEHQGVLR